MSVLAVALVACLSLVATNATWIAHQPGSSQDALVRSPHWRSVPPHERLLVAALGDSITAGTPLWHPDASMRRGMRLAAPVDERSQWMYWAAREHPELTFRNCGAPGEQFAEMARRLDTCIDGADAVVIQGGANDALHGVPTARSLRTLERMIQRARAAGVTVQLAQPPPIEILKGRGLVAMERLRDGIATLGRAHDVAVLDFYGPLADPSRPGRYRPGLTDDEIHPTVDAHRTLGRESYEVPAISRS